ncbi:MAG: excalibur calcium-binding domain-containing protein [Nocardioidaceae bacterium]|nr:excalibur calcium-binding domain-containing protein [Nocardioidaceae bacterium]NUS51179.1 excalibur calcium-binding domain-containing protein [Nocardioidaceae bacterium]
MKHTIKGGLVALAATALVATGVQAADALPAPKDYPNCTALNKVYKHGVGRRGAHDKTSGTPVTTFTRYNKVYYLNNESDRDKDGIACEKR